MRILKNKFCFFIFATVLMAGSFGLVATNYAQTTNTIPRDVFLTDDGSIFWYKPGQRLVDINKIKASQDSLESRPADQNPQGNWGQATNGFQLSLRLEKSAFTNGEQIFATSLVRNVTDKQQTYYRPIKFLLTRDGTTLKKKGDNGFKQITASPFQTLYPQTQNKFKENMTQEYDLSSGGNYEIQAICRQPYVTSQAVKFSIAK